MFSDPIKNLAHITIEHGMSVVDIGAGSGFYSIEAAKKVGNGRVFAVDVQKDILDRIKNNGANMGLHNIEVVWANAEKIGGTKLREACADRVIASNVLFQIEKPEDFTLEIRRILKPNGKLLVVDWAEASPMSPKKIVTAQAAQLLFEKAHFTLEESFDAGDHHYGLVFKKQ
jgi:ubiquinone/menaquinone biosynthesis C-methylase UbiE